MYSKKQYINDADYVVCPLVGGKQVWCVYYASWIEMKKRSCIEAKNINYLDVSCCEGWLNFSNFKSWMETQIYFKGLELDKDILKIGNKVYCPEACMFVPNKINSLLITPRKVVGEHPIGVYKNRRGGKNQYHATCCSGGGEKARKFLGLHATPLEAHAAWQREKIVQIYERLLWWRNDDYFKNSYRSDAEDALLKRVDQITYDLSHGLETKILI